MSCCYQMLVPDWLARELNNELSLVVYLIRSVAVDEEHVIG